MSTTALERRAENGRDVALFDGSTVDEILAAAADVATKFGDVVKKQRMSRRIGENDHIQIEAWQTIGALTGVVAAEGEVHALPWPQMDSLGDEPPPPGREPRNRESDEWQAWKRASKIWRSWEIHEDKLRARSMGKAFGFVCWFRATKNGAPVGWGEASVDRNEENWVNKDDHELRAMSETRAQSRALGAPLKFVVKLAGYETTPVEEMNGAPAADGALTERVAQLERELSAAHDALANAGTTSSEPGRWSVEATDEQMAQAATTIRLLARPADVDAEAFVAAMGQHLNGVPQVCVTMLRGLARFIGDARAADTAGGSPQPPADPQPDQHHPGPPDDVVYPPGHYQGD